VKKNLQYYIDEIKRQNPNFSDKEARAIAKKLFEMDPESTFKGKRKDPDPTFSLFKANEKASPTGGTTRGTTPSPTPSPTATERTTVKPPLTQPDFQPIGTGIDTDFKKFVDGTLVYNSGGTGSASLEPYVSGKTTPNQPNPKPIVILPTADGRGFVVGDLDTYVNDYIKRIPKGDLAYYKNQLKDYFPSDTAFRRSLSSGPVTDKDIDFANALKRAMQQITINNFDAGQQVGQAVQNNVLQPNAANSAGFYSFDSWVRSRIITPEPSSETSRTSGLTTKQDALAEFRRTVQEYVGEFDLVDNYDALANAYWEKLHAEELKRQSRSVSTVDPITGNRVSSGTTYAQLTQEDRLEMRLNLITKGAVNNKNKVISLGIRKATPIELQDAGGLIGDNYTKLKGYAYEYGVPLDDNQIKAKAAESLLPGGSIEEQRRSIQLASRAKYKALSPYIEGGLKVSDIASQYRSLKAQELELADGMVDIFDADVQAAITGDKLLTPDEYTMELRKNPNWRFTKKANETAAGFLDTLLKTWGYVG
jgi:hypothetical protein